MGESDKRSKYQGIPFAAPPIGEMRFRKPVRPAAWKGVRQATAFSARCIQHPKNPQDYSINGIPSENSLYLNVFAPCWKAPEGGFPVMMFIHGGLYLNGEASSYGDIGICENIVSRGVVFVTIQYRLGYLGFLSTGDAVCPGNFGLWDQVAALEWVQQNNNVTLVGQSAGAASVDLLHLSPHSTGLFHKAICMAGSAECRWALHPEMEAQTRQKAKRMGVQYDTNEELLEKLRKLPAVEFGVGIFSQVKADHLDMEVGPCLDGDFFPESLDVLRKRAKPKPFLVGVTQEEGLYAMAGRTSSTTGLADTLKEATADCVSREAMKASLRSHFIGYASPTNPSYIRAMAGMASDALFVAGIAGHCAKTVAIQKEHMYLYVFEHFNPAIMGYITPLLPFHSATHTCELFYLFKKGVLGEPPMTETEQRVMDTFTTALTNFAKYGDPNGAVECETDLPTRWDPITKQNPHLNYVITSGEPVMSDELFEGRTEDFIDIRDKYN
ncbi:hypothetical protein PRIPAC_82618 [Pristionchus pacificus]|uniref:Esterase n=1 Tax=Pristionchus pacificus TaxID=54126 RepID=A0A2A6CQ27_PRIPA|nr:hypothetical protein PRIPAC_82618 [Pristionchus pacificus]|eukprot:PDM80314.1 esterase [Pristionchus pacificus]